MVAAELMVAIIPVGIIRAVAAGIIKEAAAGITEAVGAPGVIESAVVAGPTAGVAAAGSTCVNTPVPNRRSHSLDGRQIKEEA